MNKHQDHIRTIEPEEEVKEAQAPRPQEKETGGAAGAARAAGGTYESKLVVTEPRDKVRIYC